jgi:LmbE family N-acetylglucosaminyl deacetylase
MKNEGRVVLILPHPDDEVFCLHILRYFQNYELTFIFLTNGSPTNDLRSAYRREIESRVAIDFVSKGAEILNYGLVNGLTDGKLARQFSRYDLKNLNDFIGQGSKPCFFVSPILEGGHQDHDATFIITENLCRSWAADHYTFPLYSSSHFSFPFFRTMKKSQGSLTFSQTLMSRLSFVRSTLKLIKIYKTQKGTWLGLSLPVLFHYALKAPVYYVNQTRSIENVNKFLYESRGHEKRETLKQFQYQFSPDASRNS